MKQFLTLVMSIFFAFFGAAQGPLYGISPSAVTADGTQSYLSLLNIKVPQVRRGFIRKFGDQWRQGSFTYILNELGMTEAVMDITYKHFELENFRAAFTELTGYAAPGAGNNATVTLSPGDLDANGNYFPQLNNDMTFPNGTTGKIVNVNTAGATPVLTVEPHDQTFDLGAVAAGQKLSVYSNGWQEKSLMPKGRVPKFSELSFGLKIVKTKFTMSNTARATQTYIDIDGAQGLWITGMEQGEYNQLMDIDGAALLDTPIDNPALIALGHRNMTGLLPWMRGNAPQDVYTPGLFSVSQYYLMTNEMDKQRAPKEHFSFEGTLFYNEQEQLWTNFLAQNPIIFTMNGQNDDGTLGVHLDCKSTFIGGHMIHHKKMDVFNDPELYNLPNYSFQHLAMIVPLKVYTDPKTGSTHPAVSLTHLELNGYSRRMIIEPKGGFNGMVNNSEEDALSMDYVSEVGTRFCAPNQFFLWEKA